MHIVQQLEARIVESRALLALEVDHLQRVLAVRLDASWAQGQVDQRCRYIESLEHQHHLAQTHRLALQQSELAINLSPVNQVGISDEPLSA